MNMIKHPVLTAIFVLASGLLSHAQTPSAGPQLRLERRTNGLQLIVAADTNAGVLFLLQAPALDQLLAAPDLLLLTNAPVTNDL